MPRKISFEICFFHELGTRQGMQMPNYGKNAYFSIPFKMNEESCDNEQELRKYQVQKKFFKRLNPMTNNLFPIFSIVCDKIQSSLTKVMQLPLTGCVHSDYAHLHNLYSTLTK